MDLIFVKGKPLKIPTLGQLYKISTNRKDWDSQTPNQKWSFFYGIGKACLCKTGFTVFKEDQKLKWYSYLALPFLSTYLFLAFYTIFYFVNKGEFIKCLPTTCMIGLAVSMIPLLVIVTFESRHTIHALIAYFGRYVYPDFHDDTEYNRICSKYIDATIKDFFIKMGMMFLSYFVAMIGPMRAYFFNGIRTTTTELKFPFIAEKSDGEFIGNVLFQAFLGSVGMLAYTSIEVAMGYIDNFATVFPKLIEDELRRLEHMVANRKPTKSQLGPRFRSMLKHAVNGDKFMACARELLCYRTLVAPTALSYSIAMAIFCQFTMNYAAGYGMAVITYIQLFYICELGDSIEDDGFADIIYNSNWYNLPVEYQKDIGHLIRRKQRGIKLTVGPFADINRELTTVITKRIYSFMMFLFNFTN